MSDRPTIARAVPSPDRETLRVALGTIATQAHVIAKLRAELAAHAAPSPAEPTSNAIDIAQPLADSATLWEMAKRAGITIQQARAMAAMFADIGEERTTRICVTCQYDRIRQSNREARKR